MLAYQDALSSLTLGEGLAEYYAAHGFLKRGPDLSPEAQEFFRCHDAVHVVYGCGTSLPQEAVVKLSSYFGTNGGRAVSRGYRLFESQDIYRTIAWGDILRTIALAPVIVPRTLFRCWRQKKRWPWADFASQMDRPLRDIRAELGVRVG